MLVNFTLFFTLAILFIYQKPIVVEITADETRLIDINPYLYKRIEFTGTQFNNCMVRFIYRGEQTKLEN